MKRFHYSFLAAALALAAPAYAAISPEEAQFILSCRENVTPPDGALSAEKAAECMERLNADNGRLMQDLQAEKPTFAVEVVSRSNALLDLRAIITKYDSIDLARAMSRVIERNPCVSCSMGLGPKPETISDWTDANTEDRRFYYDWSIRRWGAMWEPRRQGMAGPGFGYTEQTWTALPLLTRYDKLYDWAKKQADDLLASSAVMEKSTGSLDNNSKLVEELLFDLYPKNDYERARKLEAMLKSAALKASENKPAAATAADKKGGELTAAAGGLAAARAGGGTEAYLAGAFDNAAAGKGGVPLPGKPGTPGKPGVPGKGGRKPAEFKPVPITKDQAARLAGNMATVDKKGKMKGLLADEMRGTKAGDEIIAFYQGKEHSAKGANRLNFGITKGTGKLEGAIGWWSGTRHELMINSDVVDKFCEDRKITPAELLKSKALQKDLATYVAPVFVHEAAHQRQTAWTRAKGVDFLKTSDGKTFAPYQMEQETESFSMNAAFVAEKAKKNGPAYLSKLAWYDRADAERYLAEGVEGMRTEKHTYDYYAEHTDSVPGASAKTLQEAHNTAQWVEYLEYKAKHKPAEMTAEERKKLAVSRQALDTRFKWYREVLQKSKDDEKKLLEWRAAMNSDGALLRMIQDYKLGLGGGGS